MVPPGVPDVIQIVVFAARPYAFLSRRRALVVPLFSAREDVLELIHPRVGEQQRRVVCRDQRRRAHNLVPTLRKVVQKLLADLVTCHFLYCGRLRGVESPVAAVGGSRRMSSPERQRGDRRLIPSLRRCEKSIRTFFPNNVFYHLPICHTFTDVRG